MNLEDTEIHLLDYWRILKRRKLVALVFFAVVVAVCAVYAFTATPVYQGTTQLLVDTEKNQTLNFAEGGAVFQRRDPSEYFNTQKEILGSRLFADRVARKLQLDKNPYFVIQKAKAAEAASSGLQGLKKKIIGQFPERGKGLSADPAVRLAEELDPAVNDIILENLTSEVPQLTNIMRVKYTAAEPAVAALVANGAASALIEYNLELRVKPFQDAAEWLSARLVESKGKVEASEKALQKYREGKGVVSFESKESVITQQLQEIVSQLVQTEGRKQEAEVRYNQLQSVINSPERLASVPEIMNNIVIQGLRKDELDIKRQLSELSEKYGPKHPQIIRMESQLEAVQKNIISEARKMLNTAKTELEIAKNRESSLRRTMADQTQEVLDLSRKAIDFNVIAGESASNRQFYDLLLKKMQEASLSSGINASNLQVVDFAVPPSRPLKPRRGLILALAVFLGLFGGVFAAFFVEYMDDTVRTEADVVKLLKLPFLDLVPLATVKEGKFFMTDDPTSAVAESFRTIRTGVHLSSVDEPQQVILVTSSVPDEGKTTVSANLAMAMAQSGERVLIVDTDLRRHNLHEVFGYQAEPGLTNALQDPESLGGMIKRVEGHPSLFVLTGGGVAPNPSEILGSKRMKGFVEYARKHFDRIVLDAPPLQLFSDALVLSQISDGVILVVWGGNTPRPLVKKSVESLQAFKAHVIGAVLNKVDVSKSSGYYYYSKNYAYYYSDKKKKGRKRSKK